MRCDTTDHISGQLVWQVTSVLSCILPIWRLLKIPQWTSHWQDTNDSIPMIRMFTGSQTDGLAIPALTLRESEDENSKAYLPKSDMDAMMIVNVCDIGNAEDGDIHVFIDTRNTKPGYLQLRHADFVDVVFSRSINEQECRIQKKIFKMKRNTATGDLLPYLTLEEIQKELFNDMGQSGFRSKLSRSTQGPAANLRGPVWNHLVGSGTHKFDLDAAFAVKCKVWPNAALEWRHRARHSGWPSSNIIEDVVKEGCHMVFTAHPQSTDKSIEWRFSFTVSERTLARSLKPIQRQSYIVLKMVIFANLHPHTALSSYCLKNIFFWKMEQLPSDVWGNNELALGTMFTVVLDELIHCLGEGCLPHYFIRDNNLIDSKPRESIRAILQRLTELRKDPLKYILEFDKRYKLADSASSPICCLYETSQISRPSDLSFSQFRSSLLRIYAARLQVTALERNATDFSGILTEGLTVCPGLKTHLANLPIALASMGNSSYDRQSAIGYAWCSFVYFATSDCRLVDESLIDSFFHIARDLLDDPEDVEYLLVSLLHTISLQYRHQDEAAIEILLEDVISSEKYDETVINKI